MARVLGLSPKKPCEAVIGLNLHDPGVHDAYMINVETGKMELLATGERGLTLFPGWLIDSEMRVRGFVRANADGSKTIHLRKGRNDPFSPA